MIAAVVPVKDLARAKRRLGAALSPGQREQLCLAMLADVLAALRSAGAVGRVYVTSRDPRVLATAGREGTQPLPDRAADLNGAVGEALLAVAAAGARAVLVVPGDVPLITPEEVRHLVRTGAGPRADRPLVRVAPTRDGGTGALFLRPPLLLPPSFGPDSCARHLRAARAAGAIAEVCPLPGPGNDLDRPEDLNRFLEFERPTHTRSFLLETNAAWV